MYAKKMKDSEFTAKQAAAIKVYAETGDVVYAAAKNGYSATSGSVSRLVNSERGRAAVLRAQLERLTNVALPLAVGSLIDTLTDSKAPHNARNVAAKIVLDRTLGSPDKDDEKPEYECSSAELQQRIEAAQRQLADRAKIIIEGNNPSGPIEPGLACMD